VPAPTVTTVDVPGTTLRVWRWRRATREPGAATARVLFAHGITDDGRCWDPVVDDLLEGFPGEVDAIAYDARGHGGSQPLGCAGAPGALGRGGADHLAPPRAASQPPPPATMTRLADDLADVVAAVGGGKPLLVGHSMGAITAALASARHPGLAGGLLLEDPPSPWETHRQAPLAAEVLRGDSRPPLPEWLTALRGRDLDELVQRCRREHPHWSAVEHRTWAASKQAVSAEVGWLFAALREDWSRELSSVDCPSWVLAGDPRRGGLLPDEDAARLTAVLPGSRLRRVAGAGHCVRRDAPAEFQAVLREALREVAAGPFSTGGRAR
jgi:pimeloyl-ACP methyl ester carboxylesterase